MNEVGGSENDPGVFSLQRLSLLGVLCSGVLVLWLFTPTLRAHEEVVDEGSLAGLGEAGDFPGSVKYVYKNVGGKKLHLEIFSPDPAGYPGMRPAIVWWSGGGWQWGGLGVYERQCAYLASRGVIAVCAEYRYDEWGKDYSVAWAAEDAKSALRWLRVHAADLKMHPGRVVAAGESSGATIALQTALSPGFEAVGEDLSISSKPDALVLFDPVTDEKTLLQPFIEKSNFTVGEARRLIPALNLEADLPPTYLSYSDEDFLFDSLEAFSAEVSRRNLPVTLKKIRAQPHGFMKVTPWMEASLESVDRFLATLGYVEGPPNIQPPNLPFDLDRAVFGKGLPTVTETEWFAEPLKEFKIDKNQEVLQFSFARLKDGQTCAIAVSKSANGFTEAQMSEVASTVTAWIDDTWKKTSEEGGLVICFMAFPFRTQAVWSRPAP